MIICICKRISDREIQECVSNGLDFDGVQFELGVSMQCGCCEMSARQLISDCKTGNGENLN